MKKLVAWLLVSLSLVLAVGINTNFNSSVALAAADGTTCVLDVCDNTSNFIGTSHIDSSSYIEGKAAITAQGSIPTVTINFFDLDRSTLPNFDNAYLEFYFYINDPDNITEGQIELNSTGVFDIYEIMFAMFKTTLNLSKGWNFVSLKLTDFAQSNSEKVFDYSKLYGMRIYFITKNGIGSLGVDNITITDSPKYDEIKKSGFTVKSTKNPAIDLVVNDSVINNDSSAYKVTFIIMVCLAAVALIVSILNFTVIKKYRVKKNNSKGDNV